MLVIGNKKYRNLQEQVGWNTEQIDKIFEFLDGINVSDNVVVVGDISTPLTTEELEIVNREVAFIVYNGELYFKRNQDSSYIYFDIIFLVTSGIVITLTSSEIAVTKSNGALGITNSTDHVYSKTEVDSLLSAKADLTYLNLQLALKADLSGANFTGNITAPSIIENMTGYSFLKTTSADLTITYSYAGVVKNGNKITFAIAGIINFSAIPDLDLAQLGRFQIPSSVGAKLFPFSLSGVDALSNSRLELATNYYTYKVAPLLVVKNSNTEIAARIYALSGLSLSLNTNYYFRFESTFLLSDNLAS